MKDSFTIVREYLLMFLLANGWSLENACSLRKGERQAIIPDQNYSSNYRMITLYEFGKEVASYDIYHVDSRTLYYFIIS